MSVSCGLAYLVDPDPEMGEHWAAKVAERRVRPPPDQTCTGR